MPLERGLQNAPDPASNWDQTSFFEKDPQRLLLICLWSIKKINKEIDIQKTNSLHRSRLKIQTVNTHTQTKF